MSRYREWDLSCKVYVGNLGNNASKYEIEKVFQKYGAIRNVWVARNPPGFAFVEFEDPRDAEDSARGLDGTRCCGTRIRVEMSSGRTRRDRDRRHSSLKRRLEGPLEENRDSRRLNKTIRDKSSTTSATATSQRVATFPSNSIRLQSAVDLSYFPQPSSYNSNSSPTLDTFAQQNNLYRSRSRSPRRRSYSRGRSPSPRRGRSPSPRRRSPSPRRSLTPRRSRSDSRSRYVSTSYRRSRDRSLSGSRSRS